MSTTIKTGWIKGKNGNKFAPKTLTSQVQTSDGTLLEDKIQADLDTVKEDIFAMVFITVNDIDDICSSTSVPLISFWLGTGEYQAEVGMTWGEWIDSDYNTDYFILDDIVGVTANDVIIAGAMYEHNVTVE